MNPLLWFASDGPQEVFSLHFGDLHLGTAGPASLGGVLLLEGPEATLLVMASGPEAPATLFRTACLLQLLQQDLQMEQPHSAIKQRLTAMLQDLQKEGLTSAPLMWVVRQAAHLHWQCCGTGMLGVGVPDPGRPQVFGPTLQEGSWPLWKGGGDLLLLQGVLDQHPLLEVWKQAEQFREQDLPFSCRALLSNLPEDTGCQFVHAHQRV